MRNFLSRHRDWLFILAVYLFIFLQYPTGMAFTQLAFHHSLDTLMTPASLLLWGLVRIVIILPLIYTLVTRLSLSKNKIFAPLTTLERTTAVTFWATFGFVLLGAVLYPVFLRTTTLSVTGLLLNMPVFILYATANAYVEETYFRGLMITYFGQRLPFWLVNLIQAALFMGIHLLVPMKSNYVGFLVLTFMLGLIWGYLTKRTKSILPAVVTHIMADIFVAVSLF